jgi:hypothetical protein
MMELKIGGFVSVFKARWQAGPRDTERQAGIGSEAREPLLGKDEGLDEASKGDHRDTILFLARMATTDLHILLIAFTAGWLSCSALPMQVFRVVRGLSVFSLLKRVLPSPCQNGTYDFFLGGVRKGACHLCNWAVISIPSQSDAWGCLMGCFVRYL